MRGGGATGPGPEDRQSGPGQVPGRARGIGRAVRAFPAAAILAAALFPVIVGMAARRRRAADRSAAFVARMTNGE